MTAKQTIAAGRRPMPRLHKLLLLLAFAVVVFGFAPAELERPRGITVETTVTPNHMLT